MIVGFNNANFTKFGFAPMGVDGVFSAVSAGGVMFSLFGFRTAIDMAGEAENPQVSVPVAIIGAVVVSLAIYLMLQVAFIGVVPDAHLARGWAQRFGKRAGRAVRGVRNPPRHAVARGRALFRRRAVAVRNRNRLHRRDRAHQLRAG